MGFFPSAYHVKTIPSHTENNIRKSFYIGNQGIAVILYALSTY